MDVGKGNVYMSLFCLDLLLLMSGHSNRNDYYDYRPQFIFFMFAWHNALIKCVYFSSVQSKNVDLL